MRQNKFFDTIMIALILMSCFKLLYPDAFTFNISINGTSIESTTTPDDGDTDDDYSDLLSYDTLSDFVYSLGCGMADIAYSEDDDVPFGEDFYSENSAVELQIRGTSTTLSLIGTPVAYVDGVLWYSYFIENYDEVDSLSMGYTVLSDGEWFAPYESV